MIKTATVHELKKEMIHLKPEQVIELCARLSRFKKENKELLTYLLFEAHDEKRFVENIKSEIESLFSEINQSNGLYLIKKSLRKILRLTKKYIRFSGDKNTEVQLLLYYILKMKQLRVPVYENVTIGNIYAMQIKKIRAAILSLHEDLQADYTKELNDIMEL